MLSHSGCEDKMLACQLLSPMHSQHPCSELAVQLRVLLLLTTGDGGGGEPLGLASSTSASTP